MTTPLLQMPEYVAGQLQPEIPLNTATRVLEQGCTRFAVLADNLTHPPGTIFERDVEDGDAYIVAPGGVAEWAGQDNSIAIFIGTYWHFIPPRDGFQYTTPGGPQYTYAGADSPAGWVVDASASGPYSDTYGLGAATVQTAIDALSAVRAGRAPIREDGTSLTLNAAHNGRVVYFTSSAVVAVTLPQGSSAALPEGFVCTLIKAGAGNVVLTTEGADDLLSASNEDSPPAPATTISTLGGAAVVTLLEDSAGSPPSRLWHAEGRLS